MRKIFLMIACLGILAMSSTALTGCAVTLKYTPPNYYPKYKTTITVNKGKEQVWKSLVLGLSQSFFMINNMEKDSGFMNVSYSGEPCNYIDCGFIESKFANARGDQSSNFFACKGSQDYVAGKGTAIAWLHRTMELEGRINITVIEIDPFKTQVNINIRYIITRTFDGKTFDSNNPRVHGRDSTSFNSNGDSIIPGSKTICRANGKLEDEILNLIR